MNPDAFSQKMLKMDQPNSPGLNPEETAEAPAEASPQSFSEEVPSEPAVALPMYAEFFGLSKPPFDLTSDSQFLFLTPRLQEALSNLRYGLTFSKGFTALIGEAGTGKTTLLRAALAELDDVNSRYVLLSNPTLGRAEFYEYLVGEFGFSKRAIESKTQFLAELEADVTRRFERGGLTGLIVDEAQSMPYALLEEIRLLGNIETPTTKLFNIVLSGQPELSHRLNEPSLRQLKQRVALRCELKPLTLDETASYISGRLRIAGGAPEHIFTLQAVHAIYNASAGIPRSINVICDNALVSGFAVQRKPVNVALVSEVCRDFDFEHGTRSKTANRPEPAQPEAAATTTPPQSTAPAANQPARGERPMFESVQPKKRSLFSFFS